MYQMRLFDRIGDRRRALTVVNAGQHPITLVHESLASRAVNRFRAVREERPMNAEQIIELPVGVSVAVVIETIRALRATGGGAIKLPAGEWRANDILLAMQGDPRISLIGHGDRSVLKWVPA